MPDLPALQRIDVNGVDVAYRRAGSGDPLFFVHGMGLTRRWLDLYDALAEHFDVIVPQHPGFGDTVRPAWYRSLDDFIPHYADFLGAVGIERAHVVGHSFGGLLAGAFAATHPDRLLSLTLIAPKPFPTASHLPDAPFPENMAAYLFNDNHDAYAEYDDEGLGDLGRVYGPVDDEFSDPDAFTPEVTPALIAPGLYRWLSRITVPAQVLVPEEDRAYPPPIASDWGRWLDAPVTTIVGETYPTGHLLVVQEPDAIADRVVALAESASATARTSA